ncbi:MAG: hypothetical protein KVP17_000267 [Porospora cf. gigantea B]|uniref:uncharacterized protein n=1 Tax=Porospora cf. gigantea B TaxID=2853592 RepID=UPI003571C2C4|nr:MAG: hypothetical protein KVP17_000267 [Porospora cf. gigantea B]
MDADGFYLEGHVVEETARPQMDHADTYQTFDVKNKADVGKYDDSMVRLRRRKALLHATHDEELKNNLPGVNALVVNHKKRLRKESATTGIYSKIETHEKTSVEVRKEIRKRKRLLKRALSAHDA